MRPAWRRPLPAAWRIALPEWRRPMVVWRTTLSIGQRWFPAWRWAGAQVPRRPWMAGRGFGAFDGWKHPGAAS